MAKKVQKTLSAPVKKAMPTDADRLKRSTAKKPGKVIPTAKIDTDGDAGKSLMKKLKKLDKKGLLKKDGDGDYDGDS
jgi:phage terminase large subunit-like protein